MGNLKQNINLFFSKIMVLFPHLLILIGLLGIIITLFVMKRPDLTIRSLVLILPLFISGILLIRCKGNKEYKRSRFTRYNLARFNHLTLVFLLILFICIISLYQNSERPLEFFLLISSASGIIFYQIFLSNSSIRQAVILLEISIVSLTLIWGVTLNYPLYFGGTDPLQHLYIIDAITNLNHVSIPDSDYNSFPLFHILIAIGAQLSGLPLTISLFVIMGLIWQIGILTAYIYFKKLTGSNSLALVACLMFALNSSVIYHGMYPVTRSLAFIFFLLMLYLLLVPSKNNHKNNILMSIITLALILTHHYTAMLVIPLLILYYAIYSFTVRNLKKRKYVAMYTIFYSTSFISYLLLTNYSLVKKIIISNLNSLLSEGPTNIESVVSHTSYALSFIVNNSYSAFALLLSLLGIGYIFYSKHDYILSNDRLIGVLCVVSLIFFIPGPFDILPISDIFILYRFELLVSPFIALGMAYGIMFIIRQRRNEHSSNNHVKSKPNYLVISICTTIVILTVISSLISNNNNIDSSEMVPIKDSPRYFTTSEINSLLFMSSKADTSLAIYSDYYVIRDRYHLPDFKPLRVLTGGNISYIDEGYVIFRNEALKNLDVLIFSPNGQVGSNYPYHLSEQSHESNIILNLKEQGLSYNNGAVWISII